MRQPKPFYRKFTRSWYVQIAGKQIPLGKDKEAAFAKYHQLMASSEATKTYVTGVQELLNSYLAWVKTHRAATTYDACRFYLSSFAKSVGSRLRVADISPDHVSGWISRQSTWGNTTRHEAIGHVQRAFSWAVKRNLLHTHPLMYIEEKPPRQRREVVLSPSDWQELQTHLKEPRFRDLLIFLWETGCRPIEARTLEARYCDFANGIAIFPMAQSKGQRRRRILILNEKAQAIVESYARVNPDGTLFRNLRNRPWTKDAMKCRFTRFQKLMNLPGLCAYSFRHSYATQGLLNGVDPITLGQLMGHVDGTMVARQYQHLASNLGHLRASAARATGSIE